MRITLATSSFAPYFGGVEEHVRNAAAALRARGHDVVVWTVARDGRFEVREFEGTPVWDLPTPLPARSPRALARFGTQAPAAWSRWRQAWSSARPDILHVHCFGPNGTYARMLARATRTPLIVTSHGETLADDGGLFDGSRLARDSLTKALAAAQAVTAPSRIVLDDLEQRFGLGAGIGTVVPNGIDLHESAPAGAPVASGRYLAAVGRLQPVKGFDLLIDAFSHADLPPDVRLVVGGDGPERPVLAARAAELGLGERVILPGRLDRGQVASLFAGALGVVIPSRFEAFGVTALEAWRAGAPLVATTRGGPPEFIRDGIDGLLVDPIDAVAFARALRRIVVDSDLAARLSTEARTRLPRYSWDAVALAYESVYRRAVGR